MKILKFIPSCICVGMVKNVLDIIWPNYAGPITLYCPQLINYAPTPTVLNNDVKNLFCSEINSSDIISLFLNEHNSEVLVYSS